MSNDPEPPTVYPNPRSDDPWDSDAIGYLLAQPQVAHQWKRVPLFECLRRQANRMENDPQRVIAAAELARLHGVIQREIHDQRIGKHIVRLIRTDANAPRYPANRL